MQSASKNKRIKRKTRIITVDTEGATSAVDLNKTFSEKDTHSDRDTTTSEIDLDINKSDRDIYSFSGKTLTGAKEVISDSDEEDPQYIQTNKRRRQNTSSESNANKDYQRLENIKQKLFKIVDKNASKNTQEFKECKESRLTPPGFKSAYEEQLIDKNISESSSTPRKVINDSESSDEDAPTPKVKINTPRRNTKNITNPQNAQTTIPQLSTEEQASIDQLTNNLSKRNRQIIQEEGILKVLRKINNNKVVAGDKHLQITDDSLMLVDSPTSNRMDLQKSPNEFIIPKKTTNLSKLLEMPNRKDAADAGPSTSNRFKIFETTEQEIHEKVTNSNNQSNKNKNKKPVSDDAEDDERSENDTRKEIGTRKFKNPPIVLKGIAKSHEQIVKEIKNYIKKGFYLKYSARSTLIYIQDYNEYKMYKNKLAEDENIEFHTYTTSKEKTHAFVLRGLQGDPTPDEIKEDIEENHGIYIKNIYKMKTKYKPLYLLITDNDVTLKELQNKVKYILFTKIEWEGRRNEREITQCRRCQTWGHAASNCHRKPRCVKCAQEHYSHSCELPINGEVKCANCNGEHTASNLECPIYIMRLKQLQEKKNADKDEPQQYIPAPIPVTNAWERRKQQGTQSAIAVQPTTSTGKTQPALTYTDRPPLQGPTATGVSNDFENLMHEMNKLNSKINLKNTVLAIKKLNEMLEGINDPFSVMLTLQDFANNHLTKFNIMV